MPAKKRTPATRKAVNKSPLATPPIPPVQCGRCSTWYALKTERKGYPGMCQDCAQFLSQTGPAPF